MDIVWFPEGAGGGRFEEKVFQEALARIARDATDWMERHCFKKTVIKHPDRPEAAQFWDFPKAAVEEAVVDAVCHRSYEAGGFTSHEGKPAPRQGACASKPGPRRRRQGLRQGKGQGRPPAIILRTLPDTPRLAVVEIELQISGSETR
jgi:ATP-dependent DNA helicase RecG